MEITIIFVSLFAAFHQVTVVIGTSSLRTVCYYTNWSQYRQGPARFIPEDIDPSLCTHINYAFAKLDGNHLQAFEWNDESTTWSTGMFERFNALKQKQPELKTLLSVGGWNMGSGPFANMVATAASRRDFALDSVTFLKTRNFDGLDLDWEYPTKRGSPDDDRNNFSLLLQELRRVYDEEARTSGKPALLLTAAVGVGKDTIDTAYDIPEISKHLDFINVMAYDFHGAFDNVTGHNSPLFPRSDEIGNERYLNLAWAANYWVTKGTPANKLNIGLALYGRTFTLASSNSAVGAQVSGPGNAGDYTKTKGFLAYYEICKMENQGAVIHQIPEQKVPYAVQGNQWIGFDNVQSLTLKVDYIKHLNFGGVMVWALDCDDFRNTCGHGSYLLMHAINKAMHGGMGSVITQPPYNTTSNPSMTSQHTINPVTTNTPPTGPTTLEHFCEGKSDGLYADPANCHMYYKCTGNTSLHEPCPQDLVFNQVIQKCDWSSDAMNCI